MVDDGPKKSRLGKKNEKTAHEREKSNSISQEIEDEAALTSEPYVCSGNFHTDFRKLCARNQMAAIPEVRPRPRRPLSPPPIAVEEKTKPGKAGKKDDKLPPPDVEQEAVNENEIPELPPKTYTTKEKFEYFRPCVQVEMENPERQDTVMEVFIRGWKIDVAMMNVLNQCWTSLVKLHTINLWNTGLDGETLEMLGSIVETCPNIRILILDNNPVKSEAWNLLLKENSSIQNLSLRYCGITDAGAENLGRALGTMHRQNQKLISLDLAGNKITDAGAGHIANGLRLNRTLLVLGLSSNLIGDVGATRLAEVISRFALTHEEIITRRKLLSSHTDQKLLSVSSSLSKKESSHDRPGSVRSQVSVPAIGSKGKIAKTKKADSKGGKDDDKHDKSKGGKTKESEKEKTPKRAQSVSELSKAGAKKTDKKSRKNMASVEVENLEILENQNPLLEEVENVGASLYLVQGNMALISLNLSNNRIGDDGLNALLKALQYQTTRGNPSLKPSVELLVTSSSKHIKELTTTTPPVSSGHSLVTKVTGTGILRLCLQKNDFSPDNEDLKVITTILSTKDPLQKMGEVSQDSKQ